MKIPLAASIAWRYLVSKKANGAVGTITTVSIAAMAVATAAMICVLSVFNGFRDVITERLDTLTPDLLVTPKQGKAFENADGLASRISKAEGVEAATPTLTDNALVIFRSQELPVTIKGVDFEAYDKVADLKGIIPADFGSIPNENKRGNPGIARGLASVGIAAKLQLYPGDELFLFTPRRIGRLNPANPAASFETDSLNITGVFRSEQSDFDENLLFVPIATARTLLDRPGAASAIEIKTSPGADIGRTAKGVAAVAGPGFKISGRLEQQLPHLRMVKIEKWISFLLLGFILTIASFNLISSLAMLVIEKQASLRTLSDMGMTRRSVGAVFAWESLLVTFAGGIIGLAIGIVVCIIQQETGLIKFGGNAEALIIRAYPVRLAWEDIFLTLAPLAAIAAFTALLTAKFAKRRINLPSRAEH